MAGEINKAIEWAISIANDDNHRYSQDHDGVRTMIVLLLPFPHTNKQVCR